MQFEFYAIQLRTGGWINEEEIVIWGGHATE